MAVSTGTWRDTGSNSNLIASPFESTMSLTYAPSQPATFEIDQPEAYAPYLIHNPLEIAFQLRALQRQGTVISLYIGDGQQFFLTRLLTIDEQGGHIVLDASQHTALIIKACDTDRITLSATVDRIKVQIRPDHLQAATYQDRPALIAPLPKQMLRLQRREFFRVETPRISPVRCQLAQRRPSGVQVHDLPLFDISGGGMALIGNVELADQFSLGELFTECRLEIPGESVLSVNLRVREVLKIETINGDHQLRLGCEFVGLPGTRLALIERYITKLERERKAKESGLATT